ncbi:low-density lipoprotein receptor-related protein 1B [Nematostella vectensis]|uniref:low-density lipoprotein receptor-related protein 1B n=1 Tax=Nematostella vectensis TaxID=45351 RepID=UPI0020770D2E|nr:low-density lipoprotein receptor-related protein 1B [Nematostella vectensis]
MKTVVSLCLVLAFAAYHQVEAYSYASYCHPAYQSCHVFVCGSNLFQVPAGSHYGCCTGQIVDRRRYVCVSISGTAQIVSYNSAHHHTCSNGHLIYRHWRCDGENDCRDGSDETGCGSCSSSQFRCRNGRCVSRSWVCDKDNDCGDGSDEVQCNRAGGGWCGAGRYRCDNDRCIPRNWVCDRDNDCGDGSDETGCRGVYGKRTLKKKDDQNKQDSKQLDDILDESTVKKVESEDMAQPVNDENSAAAKARAKKYPPKTGKVDAEEEDKEPAVPNSPKKTG